jgi:hypothetical protein
VSILARGSEDPGCESSREEELRKTFKGSRTSERMDIDGWVSDDQIERLVGVRNWVDHAVVGKVRPHEIVRASTTREDTAPAEG